MLEDGDLDTMPAFTVHLSQHTLSRDDGSRPPLSLPSSRQRFRGAASAYETPSTPFFLPVCMPAVDRCASRAGPPSAPLHSRARAP
jgi:hypothetical protein